ncbi:E3 SUMO-protein ligase ZBED1-like isoform X1 [Drosophila takahashii]|uniref:E3 SUMO-protein ligase ZBED1-like isoform X1 n=1 Tax=Drosophila takahashii TaxID=29030 RepID=UPI003898FC01
MSAKKFFTEFSTNTAKCTLCCKIIKTSGNTSNLTSHLKNKHHDAFLKCSKSTTKGERESQASIQHLFLGENRKAKDKNITDSLIKMICKDNMPVRCVEKEGLKGFVKTCVPNYKLPSRSKVTNLISEKYTHCMEKLKGYFKDVNHFSFTCDGVTITNSTRSFLTITVHFLKENQLQSVCLQAARMSQSHTSEYISTLLEGACDEFGIETYKRRTLTTDNAKNMIAASRLFLGADNHVPCFAHTINLAVNDSVKNIQSFSTVLDKVKRIVMHFKHSSASMDALRKCQMDEGVPEGRIKTLIQSVDTRWNSSLDMLNSFVILAENVAFVLLSRRSSIKSPQMLTLTELNVCRDFCNVLLPFKDATEKVSGDAYVTVSLVIPMICMMLKKVKDAKIHSEEGMRTKETVLEISEERLKDLLTNKILIKATMLDPRFKKMYFDSPILVREVSQTILKEMKGSTHEEDMPFFDDEMELAMHDSIASSENDSFLNLHNKTIQLHSSEPDKAEEKEMKLFFSIPNASWQTDPLEFWNDQKQTMPNLAAVALACLITPGSSVASERLASAIKCVVCDARSRMTDQHITERVFLKSLRIDFFS